jgi:hypothetical protein
MANGRGNFGFNIGGGGGGIANLVQAPKVTPVRSVQFAPTPQRRVQRDEKDPKKQILGAIFGGASPFLAEAGLEALEKIPGVKDFLVQSRPKTLEELGIEESKFGKGTGLPSLDPITGRSAGFNPMEVERRRLRDRVDSALPISEKMVPERRTLLGKGLREALTFLPALALGDDDDGGVAAFISAAQAGKKLEGAMDEAQLENYLKRITERDKALTKDLDLTRKIAYHARQTREGDIAQFSREVLVTKDGSRKYVVSQGDPEIDFYFGSKRDSNGRPQKTVIPRGQAYLDTNITGDDTAIPNAQVGNYINTNKPTERTLGYFYPSRPTVIIDAEGNQRQARVPTTILQHPQTGEFLSAEEFKLPENGGKNWILDTRGMEGAPSLQSGAKTPQTEIFDDLNERRAAINGVIGSADVVLQIAQEAVKENDPSVFTKGGVFLNTLADKFNKEMESIDNFFVTNFGGKVRDRIIRKKDAPSSNVFAVYDAAVAHTQAFANYDGESAKTQEQRLADAQLAQVLSSLEQSTSGSVTNRLTGNVFSIGDQDEITDNVVQRGRLIAAQIRLAYAAAASEGQTGRTLSDKDVANFLEQLGYGSQSPMDVGVRTASFMGELFNRNDRDVPVAEELIKFSRSNNPTDIAQADARIASLFEFDVKNLSELRELENGKFKLSDEEALNQWLAISDRIINKNPNAANYFRYDPKDRRVKYIGFARQFTLRAAPGKNQDPRAANFLKPGGYFDTFDIVTDPSGLFLYDFAGRRKNRTTTQKRQGEGTGLGLPLIQTQPTEQRAIGNGTQR